MPANPSPPATPNTSAATIAAVVGPPLQVVVMGVSGCGKSTVGAQLAQALGVDFLEGDSLHPARNLALMAAGTPLTDADRADWLATIAGQLGAAQAAGQGRVVSCSALKRRYRDQLRAACPGLRFLHLHGTAPLLRRRLAARTGHYMPASLLDSQLAALQPPSADERAIIIDIGPPTAQVVTMALAHLQHRP